MACLVAALVVVAAWCAAVNDLGGDVLSAMLEQPSVKLERDDFGRWQIRDHSGAVFYLNGDRVMMRYTVLGPGPGLTGSICLREISGPRAERVKLMLEDRR